MPITDTQRIALRLGQSGLAAAFQIRIYLVAEVALVEVADCRFAYRLDFAGAVLGVADFLTNFENDGLGGCCCHDEDDVN